MCESNSPIAVNTISPIRFVLSVRRRIYAEIKIVGHNVRKEDLRRLKQQTTFLQEAFDKEDEQP